MGESLSKWQSEQPPPGIQQEAAIDFTNSNLSNESQSHHINLNPMCNFPSASLNTHVAHRNSVPRAHSHGRKPICSHSHLCDLSPDTPISFSLNHDSDNSDQSAHSPVLSESEDLSAASHLSNDTDSDNHHQLTAASKVSKFSLSRLSSSYSPLRSEPTTSLEHESTQNSSLQAYKNASSSSQISAPVNLSLPKAASVNGNRNHEASNSAFHSAPHFLARHMSEPSSSLNIGNIQPPPWFPYPHITPQKVLEGFHTILNTRGYAQTTSTHSSSPIQLLADFSRQRVPPLTASEPMEEEEEEDDDSTVTYSNPEYTSDNSKKRRTNKRKKGKLWEFLLDLLLSKDMNPSVVKWEDERRMVFKITNPKFVAELWGQRKSNPNMTFEKLSRAMRHYYKLNILLKVDGGPHLYQFGDLTEA